LKISGKARIYPKMFRSKPLKREKRVILTILLPNITISIGAKWGKELKLPCY